MSRRALLLLLGLLVLDLLVMAAVSQLPAASPWLNWGAPRVVVERQVVIPAERAPLASWQGVRYFQRLRLGRPGGITTLSSQTQQDLRRVTESVVAELEAHRSGALRAPLREVLREAAETAQRAPTLPAVRTEQEQVPLHPFALHLPGLAGMALHLAALGGLSALMLLAAALLPGPLRRWATPLQREGHGWLAAVGLGFLGYLAVGVMALLLALTVMGLPVAWLLLALAAILSLGGLAALSMVLGGSLGRWLGLPETSWWWAPLAGMMLLYLLTLLPFVGWALFGLALLLGFGAGLRSRFGSAEGWRSELEPPLL